MQGVAVGSPVPEFALQGTGGAWSLQACSGAPLVLYFYPRDATSGCTQEGLDFAALYPQFKKARAAILGVSPDGLASHEKFRAKMAFPFDLLADTEQQACRLFDVIQEKSMYGRKYLGVERSTFLIDGRSVLRHEWRKVKVKGHAEAVLAAVRSL